MEKLKEAIQVMALINNNKSDANQSVDNIIKPTSDKAVQTLYQTLFQKQKLQKKERHQLFNKLVGSKLKESATSTNISTQATWINHNLFIDSYMTGDAVIRFKKNIHTL